MERTYESQSMERSELWCHQPHVFCIDSSFSRISGSRPAAGHSCRGREGCPGGLSCFMNRYGKDYWLECVLADRAATASLEPRVDASCVEAVQARQVFDLVTALEVFDADDAVVIFPVRGRPRGTGRQARDSLTKTTQKVSRLEAQGGGCNRDQNMVSLTSDAAGRASRSVTASNASSKFIPRKSIPTLENSRAFMEFMAFIAFICRPAPVARDPRPAPVTAPRPAPASIPDVDLLPPIDASVAPIAAPVGSCTVRRDNPTGAALQ